MGGCSSRSMLETVDLDDDLAPLPAPENQETPVNVAGKAEEETGSIDLDVAPELELDQMNQEEVKVEEAHEAANVTPELELEEEEVKVEEAHEAVTEAEKETATLITETTTEENESPEPETSQAEETREPEEVVTAETIQVSDPQVKADADEETQAEACAEEHIDDDPAEADTFEEVENDIEESEKTTNEEEEQPATLRSRLGLWFKGSLHHFPIPSQISNFSPF